MRTMKLSKQEKAIEGALLGGAYTDAGQNHFEEIAEAIKQRKKDSVLNIRVNSGDLKNIKKKAKEFGIKYQTFISEVIHRIAHG